MAILQQDYLETTLIHLSELDPWTIRDAIEGTHIFGAIGSGKTSGSGAAIARAYLLAGFGGLVLTASPEDRELWVRYAEETGRSDSLLVFSPEHPWTFNFLDYELRRPGAGSGFTQNAVDLFMNINEVAGGSGQSGREEPTWRQGLETLLRRAIDLCYVGHGEVTMQGMFDVIRTAPQNPAVIADADWKSRSICYAYLEEGDQREKDASTAEEYAQTAKYWLQDFPTMPERMRYSIVGMFTNMADKLLTRPIRDLLCTTRQGLVPELTHEGAIIILDLPVEEYGEVGGFCQTLFKFCWQRATARREMAEDTLPCFLWADESQYFITSYDRVFQAAARRHWAPTVYLSQNLPAYYARLGEGTGRSETDALLGNLGTKIFHSNSCHITNTWAAETISKDVKYRESFGTGDNTSGHHTNFGETETVEYLTLPIEFTTLRKGGPKNNYCVEAIVLQSGRTWEFNNKTWLKTVFHQGFLQ